MTEDNTLINFIQTEISKIEPRVNSIQFDDISYNYYKGQLDAYNNVLSKITQKFEQISTTQDNMYTGELDYLVYCDGACRGNGSVKNIGGWGVYMSTYNQGTYVGEEQLNGCVHNTTNNKMELTSIIRALNIIKNRNNYRNITIRSDSQLCVNICNGVWKAKTNLDLWDTFDRLVKDFRPGSIRFEWVKGHDTDLGNNMADKLCNMAMDGYLVK